MSHFQKLSTISNGKTSKSRKSCLILPLCRTTGASEMALTAPLQSKLSSSFFIFSSLPSNMGGAGSLRRFAFCESLAVSLPRSLDEFVMMLAKASVLCFEYRITLSHLSCVLLRKPSLKRWLVASISEVLSNIALDSTFSTILSKPTSSLQTWFGLILCDNLFTASFNS